MRIIGVDPGLRHTGWGIIEIKNNRALHIDHGRISPSVDFDDGRRLVMIKTKLKKIIDDYNPNISAIEQIFVGPGIGSSLKLGMARGVSFLVLAEAGLKVLELPSKLVKKTITGYGSASKFQIKEMVTRLIGIEPKNEDGSDALAIAISAQYIVKKPEELELPKQKSALDLAIANALLKEKNV